MARSRNAARGERFSVYAQTDFAKGMIRDAPRTSIPDNGIYDATDFLLHQQGLAQKRGGTSYAGPAFGAGTYAQAVAYADFPAGSKIVAIDDLGNIYTVASGTTSDLTGTDTSTVDQPKLRVGAGKNLLVIPNSNGTSGPTKYDGSAAPSALGGTPAAGKFAAIYKTRVALGNSNANPNRIYFSPTPDIESTWDTTNSWIDTDHAITGLAALHNALLIFSSGATERIIGSTPPPGSDMDRAPVGSIGCTDARSIVVQEGNCLFANPRGVYLTNGAGFASLTTEGLIETYWQSLFSGYDPSTWTIAAGTYRSFYVVSVMNGAALQATLMCNVPRRAWWRLTNVNAMMFAQALGAADELYYADRSAARVVAFSGVLSPTATNKNDADGTAVTPFLETKMLGTGTGVKAFGWGRVSYDMRDASLDNPVLAVNVAPGVEATTYAAAPESPLAETSDETRARFRINKDSQGVSLKFQQSNASSKTEIYAIEWEERPYTVSSGGQ